MPDARLAESFLKTAERLVPKSAKRPTQANLRRSISTSYYAIFHALAKLCADALVGKTKSSRPNKAWVEVYRGLSHGSCKKACNGAGNVDFPQELKDFSDAFVQLQEARHDADYNPMVRPRKENAIFCLELAKQSIRALKAVSSTDRTAFATWVLITSQGAQQAKERVRAGDARRVRGV
jgi:uncharacterized protein (UPF0332 family)